MQNGKAARKRDVDSNATLNNEEVSRVRLTYLGIGHPPLPAAERKYHEASGPDQTKN